MITQILATLVLCLLWVVPLHATIKLQRYSTSIYSNTNAVDKTPGRLGTQSNQTSNFISVLRVGFRQYSNPYVNASSHIALANKLTLLTESPGLIYGQILFHPNPFRLVEGARLQYVLNKPSNVTIQIFDIFGRRVFNRFLIEGGEGARGGTNHLVFDASVFNYYDVSAGVYMLYIFDDKNQLIGRTKFAIVP